MRVGVGGEPPPSDLMSVGRVSVLLSSHGMDSRLCGGIY